MGLQSPDQYKRVLAHNGIRALLHAPLELAHELNVCLVVTLRHRGVGSLGSELVGLLAVGAFASSKLTPEQLRRSAAGALKQARRASARRCSKSFLR